MVLGENRPLGGEKIPAIGTDSGVVAGLAVVWC